MCGAVRNSILVIGSANIDFVARLQRLPTAGETLRADRYAQHFGGKGANQAVATSRAGGNVSFAGAVGDDELGRAVKSQLTAEGVEADLLDRVPDTKTGVALILVDAAGENMISIAAGANDEVGADRVRTLRAAIEGAKLVLLQSEIPESGCAAAVAIAAEVGTPVLWNNAPAREISEEALAATQILIVNESEALLLLGRTEISAEDESRGALDLLGLGPKEVIVTLGSHGAVHADRDGVTRVPAFPVEAVDTTAAGDVFCGALAVARVEDQPVDQALRFAQAAAALACTREGAQPSIPTRDGINRFLSNHR